MTLLFDRLSPSYIDWFTQLNNKNTPAVNRLSHDEMQDLVNISALSLVALDVQKRPVGAMMTLTEHQNYHSENYKWFQENHNDFLYIDRILVEDMAMGQGVASGLYDHIFAYAAQIKLSSIVCEINEIPPNPNSMAFHNKMGFKQIESRFNADQGKRMAMMQCLV